MSTAETHRGRRRSSSRAAIEDAASELFLEHTYAKTTIEQIASRAGVSRASFFNYFASKSDVLWGEADAVIDDIAAELARQHAASVVDGVLSALIAATRGITPERIPLAITQWELMGAREELLASGVLRFDRLAAVLRRHLASRRPDADAVVVNAASFALTGAVTAAAASWASAGVGRGDLSARLRIAVEPVCEGFRPHFG